MCDFRVDPDLVTTRHGLNAGRFAGEFACLCDLERDGIVRIQGARVSLGETYWPLARTVDAILDAYPEPEEQRHAAAA